MNGKLSMLSSSFYISVRLKGKKSGPEQFSLNLLQFTNHGKESCYLYKKAEDFDLMEGENKFRAISETTGIPMRTVKRVIKQYHDLRRERSTWPHMPPARLGANES
jgi:hypothetical protein